MADWFPVMMSHDREFVLKLRRAGVPCIVVALPWSMVAPHERQADLNHQQTLRRLAERGGLSPREACDVLNDRKSPARGQGISEIEATRELIERLKAWTT